MDVGDGSDQKLVEQIFHFHAIKGVTCKMAEMKKVALKT